jgi:hypothetical protein
MKPGAHIYIDGVIRDSNNKIVKKIRRQKGHSFVKQFVQGLLTNFAWSLATMVDTRGNVRTPTTQTSTYYTTGEVNGGSGVTTSGLVVGIGIQNFAPDSMTSNVLPSPYVASDSAGSSTYPYQAFRGELSSSDYWWSTAAFPVWLKIDLGSGASYTAFRYRIQPRYDNWTYAPKSWTLQGSNTGAFTGEQDILDTVTNDTSWVTGGSKDFTCDVTTTGYRYFRVYVTASNHGSQTYVGLSLRMFGDPAVVVPVTINDYKLTDQIRSLNHSLTVVGAPTNDLTSNYFIITRVFTNNTASSVAINEIGLYNQVVWDYSSSPVYYYFCLARDVLTSTITVAPSQNLTLNYTIKVTI